MTDKLEMTADPLERRRRIPCKPLQAHGLFFFRMRSAGRPIDRDRPGDVSRPIRRQERDHGGGIPCFPEPTGRSILRDVGLPRLLRRVQPFQDLLGVQRPGATQFTLTPRAA